MLSKIMDTGTEKEASGQRTCHTRRSKCLESTASQMLCNLGTHEAIGKEEASDSQKLVG